MDLTPLFGISVTLEQPSFLLLGLLSVVTIGSIDLAVFMVLLLRGSLVSSMKESSSGLWGLDALVSYHQQIIHDLWLLLGDLLDNLDVDDSIVEGIDDLDVFDVWNSVPSIIETFHIISETFIMLLLDGFRVLVIDGRSYVTQKLVINMAQSWSQL
jgi:hypothetical protein